MIRVEGGNKTKKKKSCVSLHDRGLQLPSLKNIYVNSVRILLKFIFSLIKTSCSTPLTWISRAVQAIYLEISAGIANLVDVGQGTTIVLGTVLR